MTWIWARIRVRVDLVVVFNKNLDWSHNVLDFIWNFEDALFMMGFEEILFAIIKFLEKIAMLFLQPS